MAKKNKDEELLAILGILLALLWWLSKLGLPLIPIPRKPDEVPPFVNPPTPSPNIPPSPITPPFTPPWIEPTPNPIPAPYDPGEVPVPTPTPDISPTPKPIIVTPPPSKMPLILIPPYPTPLPLRVIKNIREEKRYELPKPVPDKVPIQVRKNIEAEKRYMAPSAPKSALQPKTTTPGIDPLSIILPSILVGGAAVAKKVLTKPLGSPAFGVLPTFTERKRMVLKKSNF